MGEALLLDTHVLLWYFGGFRKLSARPIRQLDAAAADGRLVMSAISVYELGRLQRSGKLKPFDVEAWANRAAGRGAVALPFDFDSACETSRLPGDPPRDPCDRMLIATSRVHGFTLVTHDGAILDYAAAGNARTLEV